jgi:hypothetical protein
MGERRGESTYVVVAGWRYVRPYEACSVYRVKKERHSALPDDEVLADMFPQGSPAFWRGELDAGRAVPSDATAGDLRQLAVTRHVHEQAVVATGRCRAGGSAGRASLRRRHAACRTRHARRARLLLTHRTAGQTAQ